jgi:hypothetical protein
MVKHVILWKLKEDVNKEEVKTNAKRELESLQGKIDGLVSIKVNTCGLASSNADMMLDSLFVSEEALKAYAVHPAHQAAANNFVRPFTSERLCLDFEE